MTVGGMRHYTTYRAMITGDQQHTCQAASGGTRRGASFNPTGGRLVSVRGCGGIWRCLTTHE